MGRGAVWNGGAPDSTVARASSVLGSVGGLSFTVGGRGGESLQTESLHETRLQRSEQGVSRWLGMSRVFHAVFGKCPPPCLIQNP